MKQTFEIEKVLAVLKFIALNISCTIKHVAN